MSIYQTVYWAKKQKKTKDYQIEQLQNDHIDASMKSLGHVELDILSYCYYSSESKFKRHHIADVRDHVILIHSLYTADGTSDFYISDKQQRIQRERQLANDALINLGYDNYRLVGCRLPLYIHYFINIINGDRDEEIGEIFFKWVQEEAVEKCVTFEALNSKLINKYKNNK